MDKELKQIIAQETIKLVMEQAESPECKRSKLEDIELMEELFDAICDAMDTFIEERYAEIEGKKQPASIEAPIGGAGNPNKPTARTHTVVAGDTYWDLARKYLGDATRWKEIVDANQDLLADRPKRVFKSKGNQNPPPIPVIRPGDVLTIP